MYGIPRPIQQQAGTNDIGASAVTTAKIDDDAVTTAKINDGDVTESLLSEDDEVASTFCLGPVTHDFGSAATAVATKIIDATPCKLQVLKAVFTLIEAKAGGTGDDVTTITKEAAGTTGMTSSVTLDMSDTVYMNHLSSEVAAIGVAGADSQLAAGADIYAYTNAQTSRTAGKYSVMLFCKKIA